jgi:hypothetical protein
MTPAKARELWSAGMRFLEARIRLNSEVELINSGDKNEYTLDWLKDKAHDIVMADKLLMDTAYAVLIQ